MYRFRVIDEAEQVELIELAKERAELQMLEPVICGLHGLNGVDVRGALKGACNPKTGILSGQRHKTGQAKFFVPIASLTNTACGRTRIGSTGRGDRIRERPRVVLGPSRPFRISQNLGCCIQNRMAGSHARRTDLC